MQLLARTKRFNVFTGPACAAMLTFATPGSAQRSVNLTGKPDATIAEPFTMVSGVRELPGNRVIVTDQFEHLVFIASFGAGTRRQIGRQGDGPGEYRFPMAPIAGPQNGSWIYDATLRRVNVIGADGKFGDALAAPSTGLAGGIGSARGSDASGRLYFEGSSFNPETGGFSDSVSVVRWEPNSPRPEVVTRVWSGGRVIVERSFGKASVARSVTPYPAMDAWAVLPDGRVAVVEHEPFRISFVDAAGKVARGPSLAYAPISVGAPEREAYRAAQSTQRSSAMLKNGGSAGSMRVEPTSDAEFPRTLPPFTANAVLSTPEGEIWIGRSHTAADKTWRYDIFDARGTALGAATLGVHARVVGFGAGTVYIARTDPADDLVYLERYRR